MHGMVERIFKCSSAQRVFLGLKKACVRVYLGCKVQPVMLIPAVPGQSGAV